MYRELLDDQGTRFAQDSHSLHFSNDDSVEKRGGGAPSQCIYTKISEKIHGGKAFLATVFVSTVVSVFILFGR